jgi:branched-chain amino acid transport system permease protein
MTQVVSFLRKVNPIWYYALAGVVLLPLPLLMDDYQISVAVLAGIYIMLGLSLNVIVGYAGLFHVGHAAFYGIGAYAAAILNLNFGLPMFVLMPVGALVSGLFGLALARPLMALRGDYLCIATIAFGEVFRMVVRNDPFGLTGGPNGLSGFDRPQILGLVISQPIQFYYLVLAFVVLTLFIVVRLERSRLGRAWMYVREDEVAAEVMGINTTRVKLIAFVFGTAWAGLAGVLYASRYRLVAPESFTLMESVIMFCIVVLGGVGSIPGVVVGTVGMVVVPELVREAREWRDAWMGIAMVVMMLLRPTGLWPSRQARLESESEAVPGIQPIAPPSPPGYGSVGTQ